ncbi:MAG: FadR family transcriptional regulator [Candidatus Rokubacteria bacterium]|nr:FadR family transcriptional regulator [Candidatus Rokubacteria bacterium]
MTQIRDLIIGRRLPPGTRLGLERDLVNASGLSRPTVREAIQILEQDGLLQVKPGPKGGLIVTGLDATQVVRALGYLLEYEATPPSDFLEARKEIEVTSARLAALNATGDDLAAIAETIVELQATGRVDSVFIVDSSLRFHLAVARASRNQVLLRMTESLIDLVLRSTVRVDFTAELRDQMVRAHQRIFDAIRNHDAEGVARRMRRHLEGFTEYVESTDQSERLKNSRDTSDDLFERLRLTRTQSKV